MIAATFLFLTALLTPNPPTVELETIECKTLVPVRLIVENAAESRTEHLLTVTVNLKTGIVYKRWDLTQNERPDVMTEHVINPEKLPAYRQLAVKGIISDSVEAEIRPLFYWVDFTGADSWDRLYVDKERNGTCELYARQDEDT